MRLKVAPDDLRADTDIIQRDNHEPIRAKKIPILLKCFGRVVTVTYQLVKNNDTELCVGNGLIEISDDEPRTREAFLGRLSDRFA